MEPVLFARRSFARASRAQPDYVSRQSFVNARQSLRASMRASEAGGGRARSASVEEAAHALSSRRELASTLGLIGLSFLDFFLHCGTVSWLGSAHPSEQFGFGVFVFLALVANLAAIVSHLVHSVGAPPTVGPPGQLSELERKLQEQPGVLAGFMLLGVVSGSRPLTLSSSLQPSP